MSNETTLRPGELKDVLLKEIEAADLSNLDVQEVGTVLEVKDGVARVYGLMSAMSGEMLEITSSERGETVTALALNLEEDNLGVVVLGDFLHLKEGDEVRRTGRVLEVPVGPEMVGRVVNPLGQPLDGLGHSLCETYGGIPCFRRWRGILLLCRAHPYACVGFASTVFWAACARPGRPPGGPTDFVPPFIISTTPERFGFVDEEDFLARVDKLRSSS